MSDETTLIEETKWQYEQLAKIVIGKLTRRYINAYYYPSSQEALAKIMELVPAGASVGRGDSMTADQIGVMEELKRRNRNEIMDPFERDENGKLTASPEEYPILQKKCLLADVFITGINAITLDGKLVSTDSRGNRVGPVIYGPPKVILVAGANKIVRNLEEALDRIRTVAAPLNAKRHLLKHGAESFASFPCVKSGICADCNEPARICRKTIIIEGERSQDPDRMHVVIVGETLGI